MQIFTSLKRLGLALPMALLIGCGGSGDTEVDAAAEATEVPVEETAEAAPAAPPAAPGREVLPGASMVRDSLAKKDYDNAVGGLLALRGAAQGEAHTEYLNLYGEVLDTLRIEAATDPKAAQALAKFNLATRGR